MGGYGEIWGDTPAGTASSTGRPIRRAAWCCAWGVSRVGLPWDTARPASPSLSLSLSVFPRRSVVAMGPRGGASAGRRLRRRRVDGALWQGVVLGQVVCAAVAAALVLLAAGRVAASEAVGAAVAAEQAAAAPHKHVSRVDAAEARAERATREAVLANERDAARRRRGSLRPQHTPRSDRYAVPRGGVGTSRGCEGCKGSGIHGSACSI